MRYGIFPVMAGSQGGGPETYERELVQALARIDTENEYHLCCLSREAAHALDPATPNFAVHVLRPATRWISVPISLPWALVRNRVDLYHATFTPPPLSPKPYVFTHHCFSTFAHPEFYNPAILLRLNRLILTGLRHARRILCVSRNVLELTAQDLGIPRERMEVVYNGVGEHFQPVPRTQAADVLRLRYGIVDPFVLFVGKLEPRKNVARAIEAFHHFRHETGGDIKLVLVGRRTAATNTSIDEALERWKMREHVVELGYLTSYVLPFLYSAAEMLLFPSLWEGFGIPLIEAMACGTPAIASNLSSLPEVAAGAALLVDPYSVDEIAAAMHALHSDGALRQELRAKGLERAKDFDWEKTARETLRAYTRALE